MMMYTDEFVSSGIELALEASNRLFLQCGHHISEGGFDGLKIAHLGPALLDGEAHAGFLNPNLILAAPDGLVICDRAFVQEKKFGADPVRPMAAAGPKRYEESRSG